MSPISGNAANPVCKNGHGPLSPSQELFALDNVAPAPGVTVGGKPVLSSTGRKFFLTTFHCPECGYVEVYNADRIRP